MVNVFMSLQADKANRCAIQRLRADKLDCCPTKAMLLLLSFALLLTACGQPDAELEPAAAPADEPIAYEGTIVAMGDSLTEGLGVSADEAYPAQLEGKLLADGHLYQVINAGVSGETSSGSLSRVDWVLTLEPDIVILETGANDSLRGIDPDLTLQNLDDLVATFKANNVTVVLAGMQTMENLGAEYTADFTAAYPTVAETHNVILIPFFLEGVAAQRELNQPDGIHPTAEGYSVIVEQIYPYIVEAIDAMTSD